MNTNIHIWLKGIKYFCKTHKYLAASVKEKWIERLLVYARLIFKLLLITCLIYYLFKNNKKYTV